LQSKHTPSVAYDYYRFEGHLQNLRSVVEKYKGDRILNKTTLRFLEHHFPETCYFIKKLSEFAPDLQREGTSCSLRKPSFN